MRRAISATGHVLITVGLLLLLFVAYQLWGTGVWEARAQDALEEDFRAAQREFAERTPDDPVVGPGQPASSTTTTLAPLPPLVPGEVMGAIRIPKIGVERYVVEGVGREDLKKGPGHYPGTPLPGQVGNAAIAGHRTTYGAPFFDLDRLEPGDEIFASTVRGEYRYEVYQKLVVAPTDVWVVDNTPDAQLTLTTCNPKYSARERLVVKARLVPDASDAPVEVPPSSVPAERPGLDSLAEGLDGARQSLGPAYGWGALATLVGLVWWWCFRRWRHPLTWVAGVVPFLAVLFVFYVYLERVLPAGY
ncbi:MAG: hypothetical protein KatS3mg009_1273 [Acidimicrobiia bacterium]|nr:MAG: hypothetical protein KatS3mg009_1273 [Acidimicrobiia bacterium]